MSHSLRGGRYMLLVLGISLICVSAVAQESNAQTILSGAQKATHLLGLGDVKQNSNGKLLISSDGLTFSDAAGDTRITTASIEDVFTGQDSRQTGGKAMTVAKMGIPYGGARVLSLFTREKFDSLTVKYRDSNGGLHAAIFRLPQGHAPEAKKRLIVMGARTGSPQVTASNTTNDVAKEKK